MPPLLILAIAVALVLGLILGLRLNAFVALISAAMVVSLLAPGELTDKVPRVAQAFGASAGKIGVPIAMAAVIGACLLASGAADRVIRAMLGLFGEKRGDMALATSGFTLSIPVFFDTVFFLLVPLGRSLFRRTGKHYLRYLLAIGMGAGIAHTLVPPTPGPLLVADQLGVDIGLMMLGGLAVGIPAMAVGLLIAAWLDRVVRLDNPPTLKAETPPEPAEAASQLGLFTAVLPILLPVLLVASKTILERLATGAEATAPIARMAGVAKLLGDANFAMLLAAAVALLVYLRVKRPTVAERAQLVEEALVSSGMIILVTAAGGAFGAMLKAAQIGPAIQQLFSGTGTEAGGLGLLWLAFGVASLLKISQGSSTVAMITSSAMLASMVEGQPLDYNPVYLALAIGSGSLFGLWMNDSGFWLFCRMGGLSEAEALRSWTVILAAVALIAMLIIFTLAVVLPLPIASPAG